MKEKLKIKIAEIIIEGISILVWHKIAKMDDGKTKEMQQRYLVEANNLTDILKQEYDNFK